MIKEKKHHQRGQSLLEVVFALVIAALVIGAIVSLTAVAVRNSAFARNRTLATRYLQETSEWLRQQRDEDWDDLDTHTPSTQNMGNLGWGGADLIIPDTIFSREVILSYDGSNEAISAEVTVSWQDAKGDHNVTSRVRFTSWQEP